MKKSKQEEMSILEASEYFDEHDIFESEGVEEVEGITFKLRKKKYVGLDLELFNKVKEKARQLNKSEDALLRQWVMEKVG